MRSVSGVSIRRSVRADGSRYTATSVDAKPSQEDAGKFIDILYCSLFTYVLIIHLSKERWKDVKEEVEKGKNDKKIEREGSYHTIDTAHVILLS